MRELLAITDVTNMWSDTVCIAGVTEKLECIRPVIDGGVGVWNLYKSGKPVIYPGAKVWMNLSTTDIVPPHIEDRTFELSSVEHKDDFEPRHWEKLLSMTSYQSVEEVFDGNLHERRVAPGADTRSLGTIKNVTVHDLQVESSHKRVALRLDFEDESGTVYKRFPVNDLAFRGLFDQLSGQGLNRPAASRNMLERIQDADRVYLRLGLTRPVAIGNYEEACWAQVTGIYTFPDYLGGKTWADFP